jgi:nifR3 family TIM-barrel protein
VHTQLRPLAIGRLKVWPPVVLAPMAGITNASFRALCRESGAGLYVSEMITSRGLVERHDKTLKMLRFPPEEQPRSVQLYGVDPQAVGKAVTQLVEEHGVAHVDLNFGCPVPKVTRKGGGSALPYKRRLFQAIVNAAVRAAGNVPLTVKMRKGIDDETLTYLEAGRIAADEGAAAVALHGRTAAQFYGGQADWPAIARLKERVSTVPVLGNGDIWSVGDAQRMMRETGCDGVVVGRGCLGRPWLFGQLAAAYDGGPQPPDPDLGGVARVLRRHGELLAEEMGEERGVRDLRKHMAWYLKGFVVGQELRQRLGMVGSLPELDDLLGKLDTDQPYPRDTAAAPRGRTSGSRRVALPEGWLDDPDEMASSDEELTAVSGG